MNAIITGLVIVFSLLSDGFAGTTPCTNAFVVILGKSRAEDQLLRLPVPDATLVKDLVSTTPSSESEPQTPLEPDIMVMIDGIRYALVPDAVILLLGDRSKHWNSPGIRERLLKAATNTTVNQPSQPIGGKLGSG